MSQNELDNLTLNYCDSNPRCSRCRYITKRFLEEQCVWAAYLALLIIVIVDHKSLAELIFLLALLILILIQLTGSYRRALES